MRAVIGRDAAGEAGGWVGIGRRRVIAVVVVADEVVTANDLAVRVTGNIPDDGRIIGGVKGGRNGAIAAEIGMLVVNAAVDDADLDACAGGIQANRVPELGRADERNAALEALAHRNKRM